MTPLGVVFLFMLVNWWVEKHQRFYSTSTDVFFYFCHVLTFFLFFFPERFFTSMPHVATVTVTHGHRTDPNLDPPSMTSY